MFTDYILNGQGQGELGSQLGACRFDTGLMRPYIDDRGRRCVLVNEGFNKKGEPSYRKLSISQAMDLGFPVINAGTALRKQEWVMLDQVIVKAARQRLRAWTDLSAASPYGGFNGMSKTFLEHETMTDPGEALVDMDGLTEGRSDAPRFQLEGVPLPITHSDFWMSSRKLAQSRNGGSPLDTVMGEAAGRRVAEKIEQTLIGTTTGLTYGSTASGGAGLPYGRTPTVYGYTNFPARLTKTDLTVPTGSNPEATVDDVLAMLDLAYAAKFYGPFMLYHSTDWDRYMDNDYILTGGNVATQTLRNRLRSIESIQDVRRLDFLTPALSHAFTLVMVQMTSEVVQAVNGMDITTVQWESVGGMRLNFKVMAIQVPRFRADYYGNCGVVHARTA